MTMTDEAPGQGRPEDETQPFWDAAARGVLLLKRCVDTGTAFHYPREYSPFTGGATEWIEASGTGEIYACSTSFRAQPPYCIAYIRLDEGPLFLSNVEAADLAEIRIGRRVRAEFREQGDGRHAPFFVLAD